MIPLLSIRQPAFVASWANAFTELPFRFPVLRRIIDSLLSSSTTPISETIARSVPLGKISPSTCHVLGKFNKAIFCHCFFQCSVSTRKCPTARDLSLHYPYTGSVRTQFLRFCLASFLRLGLPIAFSSWTSTCNRGALIDDSGYHLLICKTGGRPVWSHKSISSVWSDCYRGLHIHHRRESRSHYTTADNRPDIVFFDSDIGNNVDLDIFLAHPWSSDIFPSSAGVGGVAAERRADRKKEKYNKQQLPGGIIATVTPLVMGHFGAWRIDGWNLLCKLSKKSSDKVGRPNAAEFIDFWSKRFFYSAPEV